MMKRQTIDPPKHPDEIIFYDMDFSTSLASGDSCSGSYSVSISQQDTGADKTSSMTYGSVSRTGSVVRVFVMGGESGKKYELKYKTATAGGEVLTEILVLPVKS